MNVFWREKPLEGIEIDLLTETRVAQFNAAMRPNASSSVIQLCAQSGVPFSQAVSAATATIGGMHAPIEVIYAILQKLSEDPDASLPDRVPGWGNSFIKGEPDPLFDGVASLLGMFNPNLADTISYVTYRLKERVFPNPGCWTAAVAITLEIPAPLASYIFLSPRMDAWAAIYQANKQ